MFLNNTFTFNYHFNIQGVGTGWSPYIEIYLPGNITLENVDYLGNTITPQKIGTFNSNGEGVKDPFNNSDISNPKYANYTLYTLEFPIGSFTNGTDDAIMYIKALLNGDVDVHDIQEIYAIPVFKFSDDKFTPSQSTFGSEVVGYIDPIVMNVVKNTTLHDYETATGPNYPFPYYVDVTIANGKTVYNVTLNDTLPNQLKFKEISSIIINGQTITDFASNSEINITKPNENYTGGNLVIKFNNLTGTSNPTTARIWYNVYAPEFDNNTIKGTNLTIINKDSGASNRTINTVNASCVYNTETIKDYSDVNVTLRSLAIQKGVQGYGWGSNVNLNTKLNYTAYFQVSDYFDISVLTIKDIFGTIKDEGSAQVFNNSEPVTLNITLNNYTYTYTLTEGTGYNLINNTNGTQDVIFNIGDVLKNNNVHNITNLTGGYYTDRNNNVGYAIGTLHFTVSIGDKYTNKTKVDEGINAGINGGDPVNNNVYINGTLINSQKTVNDNGGTHLIVATPTINKTIYAVNNQTDYKGNASCYNSTSNQVLVHVGDNITYIINFTVPSGSEIGLTITDHLPIPFYYATQFIAVNGNGTNTTTGVTPTAGHWAYGTDSAILTNLTGNNIAVNFNSTNASNLIKWSFGDVYSNGASKTVILLYTVTVSSNKIPDEVFKTNTVSLKFKNTNLDTNNSDAMVWVLTQMPELVINKTVNTTESVVNGTNVTYTIIVNNTGHAPAYNVTLVDNFNSLNISNNATVIDSLKITYSNGTSITLSPNQQKSFFNGTGLVITSLTNGTYLNITYHVVFNENLIPNSKYINTANITAFYSSPEAGAENYVNTTDSAYHSTAEVKTTSLNFTKEYVKSNDTINSFKNLTIGETGIWYLNVTLPKNLNVTNLTIEDILPTGFLYTNLTINTTSTNYSFIDFLNVNTVTNTTSNKVTNVTIKFSKDYFSSTVENFTIILYSVVTENATSRTVSSVNLTNTAYLKWATGVKNYTIKKNAKVEVIQPVLTIQKEFNPKTMVNDYSNVTITIKNTGLTNALNVTVFDNMSKYGNDFNQIDWNATVTYPDNTVKTVQIVDGVLSIDTGNLTPGKSITIKYNMTLNNYKFLVGNEYTNTVNLTYYTMNSTYPYRANYTTSSTATLKTDIVTISKNLTNSSYEGSSGKNLIIGENATFNITFTLSRGQYGNLTLTDTLPNGMVLDPNSIKISFNNGYFDGTLSNITSISGDNQNFTILFFTNSTNNATISKVMDNNITVTYNATLQNIVGNTNGKVLTNNASLNWTAIETAHITKENVTIVEPVLNVNKTANVTNLNLGDEFSYNITISHDKNSAANATNIVINDTLPDGIIYTSTTNYTTDNGNVMVNFTDNTHAIITIKKLDLGENLSIILNTQLINDMSYANKNIVNIVNVTYTNPTGDRTNNVSNKTTVHTNLVDLVITKTNSTLVVSGHNVTYVIIVQNNGPDTAENVIIKDLIPSILSNVTYTYGNNENVPYTDAGINVGTITSGNTVTVTITGHIAVENRVENITNSANVTTTTTENITTNNKVNITNNLTDDIDLQINKTVTNINPAYNSDITYTITVKNNGPSTALHVFVNETLPDGLILKSSHATAGTYYNSTNGIWTIGTMDNGTTVTLTLTVTVNKTGNISNYVNVTSSCNDTNSSNDNYTLNITVNKTVDLSIIKTASVYDLYPGDRLTYTITVSNYGPDNATGVNVTDLLPTGVTYISDNSSNAYDKNTGIWTIGNLTKGQSISLTITVEVHQIGGITNYADVTGNEDETDLNNNHAQVTVNDITTDLFVNKTVSNNNPDVGDIINYTITVGNNGPYTSNGIIVNEVLPNGLIYISDDSNGAYNKTTGVWTIGGLNNGETASLKITVRVNNTGVISNNVNVTGTEPETNYNNNHYTLNITVPYADLSINKTIILINNTQYQSNISYVITVVNNGIDTAKNILVNDSLPEGLIYISDNSNGTYNTTTGLWTIGDLYQGQSVNLTINVKINTSGNITNYASVNSTTYDPNKTNNNDNVTITVPKTVDLSINVTVSNTHPTLGETVIWVINIKNNGIDNDTDVFVSNITFNIKLLGVSASRGEFNESTGIWHIGDFDSGDTATIILTTKANKLGIETLSPYIEGNKNETTYINNNATANITVTSDNGTSGNNSTPVHPVHPENPNYPNGNPLNPNYNPNQLHDNGLTANNSNSNNGVSMKDTGNPILVLLLILAVLGGIIPYNKKRE